MRRPDFTLASLLVSLTFHDSFLHKCSVFANNRQETIGERVQAGEKESIDLMDHDQTHEDRVDEGEMEMKMKTFEMEEESSEDEDQDEVEVIPLSSLDDISNLLLDPMHGSEVQSATLQKYLAFEPHMTFVLTLVYSIKCSASQERFDQFAQEIPKLWREKHRTTSELNGSSTSSSLPPPVLILFSVDEQDASNELVGHIESFGITHLPALIWMVRDPVENTFVLDFSAAESPHNLTATEILQSFQHLQSRLLWLTSSTMFDNDSGVFHLTPRNFSATKQQTPQNESIPATSPLEEWVLDHGAQIFQSTIPASFSALSETEYNFVQNLWYGEGQSAHDGFTLLGQCRTENIVKRKSLLLETFDRFMSSWIDRRDVAFVGIDDCPGAEHDVGKVYLWRIHPTAFSQGALDLSWEAAEREIFTDVSNEDAAENLKNALVGATTPSVMWLDRQVSSAIAFPTWRKVHAVLVVDLHRAWNEGTQTSVDQRQADALRRFRHFCREYQRNPKAEDMVCLVVPSTDVRTLTIFGIDVWTPMDLAAWQPEGQNDPEILPVVFITDQRFGGTRRYYAHRDELDNDEAFSNFWLNFWDGTLEAHHKSSPRSRTNKAGIRIVTAADFEDEVLRQLPTGDISEGVVEGKRGAVKHALVLFTTKSCGHCRRLMALWDQVGRLFQKLGWSSFVKLYQLDVSTDEVSKSPAWNHTIRWVPDLLYVSLTDNRVVRYAEKDNYGDHVVGGVKSHMDLVEWFMHVAEMEQSQILQLLAEVRNVIQEDGRTTKKA